jgi:hypothetical protein
MGNYKLRTKNILNKLINDTISEEISWIYIGTTNKDGLLKNIFINFENIIGDKYLVVELHIYDKIYLNKIFIYMQNNINNNKINIKEIEYSSKIKTLSHYVLESILSTTDDDNFLDIYNKLKNIYS